MLSPMLIGAMGDAFDSPDYLFELKLDGERCLAFLDHDKTELRNKRGDLMLPKFPELSQIHRQVKTSCVLDGELMVQKNGAPDFHEVQRRSLLGNRFKIELAAGQFPASFVAFDILERNGESLIGRPLLERKDMLSQTVRESERLALSRYIEQKGTALYELAAKQGLEGIVAKRKDSIYLPGQRTKDWIKIKNLLDDDFVVCGYIHKEKGVVSLVLGQYREGKLQYQGHVTMGVNREKRPPLIPRPAMKTPFGSRSGMSAPCCIWPLPRASCASPSSRVCALTNLPRNVWSMRVQCRRTPGSVSAD